MNRKHTDVNGEKKEYYKYKHIQNLRKNAKLSKISTTGVSREEEKKYEAEETFKSQWPKSF